MDFDYFYGRETEQFAFYQIPKTLITDDKFAGISMEAKVLYSLMLDRAALDRKTEARPRKTNKNIRKGFCY